jgi:N-acetylglucosamine-6-phosphate deacetylase
LTSITAILAGTIYTPTEEIRDGAVLIEDGKIASLGRKKQVKIPASAKVIDHRDSILVPGFVDLHVHGGAGHDFMEATPEAVTAVATYLARHGATSFLATTVTAGLERTLQAARGLGAIIRAWRASTRSAGAQPLGIHFEGPFLSIERRGVHPALHILKPSVDVLERLLAAADGTARVLTLAPELDDNLAVLDYARRHGLCVGIGNSNATYEVAERAIAAGATHAIHLYNAMRPFSHRDPGIIGAVLTDDRVSAELICDGVHVDPVAIRLLVRSKGLERVILITDSLSCAGVPEGTYRLGELTVRVADGACRTPEGTLAGSILTLDVALRNFSRFTGLSYGECLRCATLNPAKILGLEKQKGSVTPGADADLVVLDRNYEVIATYVGGEPAP